MSHPSWVRGLKQTAVVIRIVLDDVAPLVGAWIETCPSRLLPSAPFRRTPRGCVD